MPSAPRLDGRTTHPERAGTWSSASWWDCPLAHLVLAKPPCGLSMPTDSCPKEERTTWGTGNGLLIDLAEVPQGFVGHNLVGVDEAKPGCGHTPGFSEVGEQCKVRPAWNVMAYATRIAYVPCSGVMALSCLSGRRKRKKSRQAKADRDIDGKCGGSTTKLSARQDNGGSGYSAVHGRDRTT